MKTERFGVFETPMNLKCKLWTCSKKKTISIGDKKQPYSPANYHLCDEHGKMLYEELAKRYGGKVEETPNNAKNRVLEVLLEETGKITKAKLAEIYTEVTGEVPTEDMTFKTLFVKMFPELEK